MALVAACLTFGTVAAPSAVAADGDGKAKAAKSAKVAKKGKSKAQSSQNRRSRVTARSVNRKLNTTRKTLTTARRRLNTARTELRTLGRNLATLQERLKGAEGGVSLLLGAAPQLVTGLQTLAGAVQNQIAPGLLQIQGVLRDQVQPALIRLRDEVGPGLLELKAALEEQVEPALTDIGEFIGATEYGIGQLVVIEAGPTPNPQEGSFLVTPDLPDTVQQGQTTQEFVAQQSGVLAVAYGVRSGENDGTGAANPAALCKVTVTNAAGDTETTAPNGAIGGLPFQPVNTKSALTSTTPANAGFPFGLKTDNTAGDADVTTTFASTVAVTAGDTYTAGLSCVDTSPDPEDPEA